MSMEAFSQARKQKLALLRAHRSAEASGQHLPHSSSSSQIKRHFRNYDPITGQFRRFTSARDLPDTIEKDTADLQSTTISFFEASRKEDLDLTNIAPKRPNWDLKRDLEKRLKKLERRDKEAVILLIRERIQGQQNAAGLDANSGSRGEQSLSAVNAEIVASATADIGQDDGSDLTDDDQDAQSGSDAE
ncbi:probable Coiled-coil domain-containing protein 12 (CCDC12) [Melanopsichium pennsylvanicum]|uniref:Coiled-coil domain-containing protein 12 (CCDC12) n=2 Tax=Melanopsichium pennsylvanicum TaxID=63383 RepID=A0A077R258_9BASI|nr:Coiled-coil domain-containing protein 12 (CCDC12) [Melanopsichium pennsylvanicum 4]SNX87836.1 probable Coiled-coil domain-containing protein 12 (CCDC12) [Melanopsichium pennsylvanicum]